MKNMTVCYFGMYDPGYSRNRVLIKGLEENGVKIIHCRAQEKGYIKYYLLVKRFLQVKNNCDIVLVAYPGQTVMPIAWILAKAYRKKIVFDVFVSLYDAIILDRKSYSRYSFGAVKYWFLDCFSCLLADVVIAEVSELAKYFTKTFGIKESKFRRIFVGSDDGILFPRPGKSAGNELIVHFHGTYIPTQGIPFIIEAAKLLEKENIRFRLIGKLQAYQEAIAMARALKLEKVEFIDFVPYEKLAGYMAAADICLGMFGDTDRAKRSGALKIVEALAMGRPLITADSAAMRELLADRENCLFCKSADANDLADKILMLKNDPVLREKIAVNGHRLFKEKLTPKALGGQLKNILAECLAL